MANILTRENPGYVSNLQMLQATRDYFSETSYSALHSRIIRTDFLLAIFAQRPTTFYMNFLR